MTEPIHRDTWERDLRAAHDAATLALDAYNRAAGTLDHAERHLASERHRVAHLRFSAFLYRCCHAFGPRDVARTLGDGMTAREVEGILEDCHANRYLIVDGGEYRYTTLDPSLPLGSTWSGAWSQGVR